MELLEEKTTEEEEKKTTFLLISFGLVQQLVTVGAPLCV